MEVAAAVEGTSGGLVRVGHGAAGGEGAAEWGATYAIFSKENVIYSTFRGSHLHDTMSGLSPMENLGLGAGTGVCVKLMNYPLLNWKNAR
jgi:hypothetical protein